MGTGDCRKARAFSTRPYYPRDPEGNDLWIEERIMARIFTNSIDRKGNITLARSHDRGATTNVAGQVHGGYTPPDPSSV